MALVILNVLCLLGVLLIAYWWGNQGLFSAFIHLLCVITAGAIAFAVWEPLTLGLFMKGSAFDRYAWAFALVGTFALTLAVLRVATNKLIPANVKLPRWADLGFGLPVGAASGVLSMGILLLAAGFVQSQKEIFGFVGYARNTSSTVVRVNSMWIPYHEITADFYDLLSVGSFRTGRPMRHYYPNLAQMSGSLVRDTFKKGRAQVSLRPSQVQVLESWMCPNRAIVKVRFGRGARDFGEQLTLSSSQVRLVSTAGGTQKPLVEHPTRWRQSVKEGPDRTFVFDDISHFITTVPGRETADVLIEFPWREGYVPHFVQIKGTRLMLRNVQPADEAQCDGILQGAATAAAPRNTRVGGARLGPTDLRMANDIRPVTTSTNMLPGSMKQQDRFLTEGFGVFQTGGSMNVARNLRILGFYEPPGTRVLQLSVDRDSPANIYGDVKRQVSERDRPALVDRNGNTYSAIGYLHEAPEGVEIVLDPADGVDIGGLPHVPSSGRHRLRLIFQVTEGVSIVGFRVGDVNVASCNLNVEIKR
jgi:hypothetical protein